MADHTTRQSVSEEARIAAEVLAHPKFKEMAKQKSLVGWTFSGIMFTVYVMYIWIIGTNPQFLATKVADEGVTTLGIYVGIFIIVFSFLITLVYVTIANGKFETATKNVVQEIMKAD